MWHNYIDTDFTFNVDRAEIITVCKNDNEEKFNKGDKHYKKICNVLNGKKVEFSSQNPIAYKAVKTLKFTNSSRTKEIYFYRDKSDKNTVTVIISDIFGDIESSVSSKFPYYIITTITYDEYLNIFKY